MKTKLSLTFATVLLVLAILACTVNIPIGPTPTPVPTPTPYPTYTLLPTYTLMPTYTLVPTYTPVPTETPLPLIEGIDYPIAVLNVTFRFYSASLTNGPISMGPNTIPPNPGYSMLKVSAYYTGDVKALISGALQPNGAFYINDGSPQNEDWSSAVWSSNNIDFAFGVKTGSIKFILNNSVGKPWSIDLSPLLH